MRTQSYESGLLTEANDQALRRILAVYPRWNGIVRVGDVVRNEGLCLYHAGPRYADVAGIPAPVLNSLAFGCLYERWAASWDEAEAMIASGTVKVLPAQENGLLVPLAGAISPSMAAVRINDPATGRERFCVLNEGADIATRLGRRDDRLLDHHRWLNGELGDWLTGCLSEPLDILPLLVESFAQGDDGHAQTAAGSRLVSAALRRRAFDTPGRILEFLNASPAFALNIWMASIALISSAAEGIADATLVTRAGGNGVQFGYTLAGQPEKWWLSDAPVPVGTVEARFDGSVPVGAVGDSAVIDFFGLGGMNLATAPTLAAALAGHLPEDAQDRGSAVLAGKHPALGGRMVGCLADRAAEYDHGPIVLIGMIDAAGKAGRIGGGVVDVPGALFRTIADVVA